MVQQQSVVTFRTDRLVAERLRDEHLDEIRRTRRDPKVTATLGGPRSDDETARYLHDNLDHWDRCGIWLFGDRADGRFAGRGSAEHPRWRRRRGGAGPRARGRVLENRGLATAMAEAMLGLALEELGMTDVVCFALPHNRASWRVMGKVGFGCERDVVHAGLPHVLYCITVRK